MENTGVEFDKHLSSKITQLRATLQINIVQKCMDDFNRLLESRHPSSEEELREIVGTVLDEAVVNGMKVGRKLG